MVPVPAVVPVPAAVPVLAAVPEPDVVPVSLPADGDCVPESAGCGDAYVYCPGRSTCFLDPTFNDNTPPPGVNAWGWNIRYNSTEDAIVEDCEIWMGVTGCDFSTGVQVGTAVITRDIFHYCLDLNDYEANAFHLYAGKCEASDGGAHLVDGEICIASGIAQYARFTEEYTLVNEGSAMQHTFTFDQSDAVNPHWAGYEAFPLGVDGSEYLVGHARICPASSADPMNISKTAPLTTVHVPTSSATVPSIAPVFFDDADLDTLPVTVERSPIDHPTSGSSNVTFDPAVAATSSSESSSSPVDSSFSAVVAVPIALNSTNGSTSFPSATPILQLSSSPSRLAIETPGDSASATPSAQTLSTPSTIRTNKPATISPVRIVDDHLSRSPATAPTVAPR